MPFMALVGVGVVASIGILIGAFLGVNVVSAILSSADKKLTEFLAGIGTSEFDQPMAQSVKRFTEKPKPATEGKKAEPKAADAGGAKKADHGHAAAAPAGEALNDTSLTKIEKVWIDPGCIVCDACVQTCPEVFVIEGDTCIIVPKPALEKVDEIKESAAGCPVNVIRYS